MRSGASAGPAARRPPGARRRRRWPRRPGPEPAASRPRRSQTWPTTSPTSAQAPQGNSGNQDIGRWPPIYELMARGIQLGHAGRGPRADPARSGHAATASGSQMRGRPAAGRSDERQQQQRRADAVEDVDPEDLRPAAPEARPARAPAAGTGRPAPAPAAPAARPTRASRRWRLPWASWRSKTMADETPTRNRNRRDGIPEACRTRNQPGPCRSAGSIQASKLWARIMRTTATPRSQSMTTIRPVVSAAGADWASADQAAPSLPELAGAPARVRPEDAAPMPPRRIQLAYSADADDAFMFHALRTGAVDLGGLEFEHQRGDTAALNALAAAEGADVVAVSLAALPEDRRPVPAAAPRRLGGPRLRAGAGRPARPWRAWPS